MMADPADFPTAPVSLADPQLDALQKTLANPVAATKRAMLTKEQADALAQVLADQGQASEMQHRMAMAEAMQMKPQPQHSTGLGGMFGALGQGLQAANTKKMQGNYDAMLNAMKTPQQLAVKALLKAQGVYDPDDSNAMGVSGDVSPSVDLSGGSY